MLESNPARIDNTFLSKFEEFEKFRKKAAQDEAENHQPAGAAITSQTQTPDEIIRAAHRQIESSLEQELLDRIRAARPEFFERLIVNLLLSMGFGGSIADAGRALGRSGDDGVDGVIDQDALSGSTGFTYKRNAMPWAAILALPPYGNSLAASTVTRQPRASS